MPTSQRAVRYLRRRARRRGRVHRRHTTAVATVPKGGAITQAVTSDGKSFHPYLTTDTASSGLMGYVYGGGS